MERLTPLKVSSRRHLSLEKRDTWGISELDMIYIWKWKDKLIAVATECKALRTALFSAQTRLMKDIIMRKISVCNRQMRMCMEGVRNQLRITDPVALNVINNVGPRPRHAVRTVYDFSDHLSEKFRFRCGVQHP
jgi:hypothetical protein